MLQREWKMMADGSTEDQSKVPLQRFRISRKDVKQSNNSPVLEYRDTLGHSIQPSNLPIGLPQGTDSEDISSFILNSNNTKNVPNHVRLDVPSDNFDNRLGESISISVNRRLRDTSSDRSSVIQLAKQPSVPQPFKQSPVIPLGNMLSRRSHLSGILTSDNTHYHSESEDKASHDDTTNDSHLRLLSHQNQLPTNLRHQLSKTHSIRSKPQDGVLANSFASNPLRVIFVRHGERVNQALGLDWFNRAFRSGRYQPFDANLPMVLPKRHSERSYCFDSPLTVRGLQTARDTGTALMNFNITASVCLSSIAIRCVQTAERLLAGMNCRDRVSIRVEPGLFECPHTNKQIVDSFITVKELIDNGYPIKGEYRPIVDAVRVPESLQGYFERSTTVMRSILDRYGRCGETILIVTHAPGLRVLTDALKGVRTVEENFYRVVSSYSPLAIYVSEYDGTKWKHSEHPLTIPTQAQNTITKEHGNTKKITQAKHHLK